ncbi:hypothetical protein Agub_g3807 [Astrephomene gubernaculifera]|uniref:Carboxypeptidase n=1 Tax=Astrephomene gubernaculifera TaxID=47775 RepID=A0AAD3DKJ1_9CHLO|nr:hypothetical protein Agub_g3807 [Astrephomene gubernaculifera]
MSELGPFYPLPGGETLQVNPHAWNNFAHVLFLESPAFVGFSYSNTTEDAIVGDGRTAVDSRTFLLRFLERFPRFRNTPFYIAGESYAGHYVPNLALVVVEGNKAAAATGDAKINIQGFMVGNPWTDATIDNLGAVDYWWSHALISDQTALGIRTNCNFSRIGPLDPHPAHSDAETRDELCDDFCNKAFEELGDINIYEIYADMCSEPPTLRKQIAAFGWALRGSSGGAGTAGAAASAVGVRAATEATSGRRRQQLQITHKQQPLTDTSASSTTRGSSVSKDFAKGGMTAKITAAVSYKRSRMSYSGDGADAGYDPCVDNEVETYLNLPEVQRALHANQTVKLPWRWTDCTRSIVYSRDDLLASMLPVYQRLLQTDLRMLVYSGDVDGIVPVVGTRRWVASLRLKERTAWQPWIPSDGQVGGYVVEYDGLTFATVRGAGHMVPYVQPARGAHLAQAFLEGRSL